MLWKKLSSVVIDYVSLLPEIHGAVLRSIKFFPFLWKLRNQGQEILFLCCGWLNGKGVIMLLHKNSLALRIIWIFNSIQFIQLCVYWIMFTEHASSSFHSYSCLFRQGSHKELQAPYVIITIFIIYMWTTTKSQIIMQMSYNHFMFMQIYANLFKICK